jgi:hypothetical protein
MRTSSSREKDYLQSGLEKIEKRGESESGRHTHLLVLSQTLLGLRELVALGLVRHHIIVMRSHVVVYMVEIENEKAGAWRWLVLCNSNLCQSGLFA